MKPKTLSNGYHAKINLETNSANTVNFTNPVRLTHLKIHKPNSQIKTSDKNLLSETKITGNSKGTVKFFAREKDNWIFIEETPIENLRQGVNISLQRELVTDKVVVRGEGVKLSCVFIYESIGNDKVRKSGPKEEDPDYKGKSIKEEVERIMNAKGFNKIKLQDSDIKEFTTDEENPRRPKERDVFIDKENLEICFSALKKRDLEDKKDRSVKELGNWLNRTLKETGMSVEKGYEEVVELLTEIGKFLSEKIVLYDDSFLLMDILILCVRLSKDGKKINKVG